LRFPHPLALLTLGILLAAALTYLVPAGEFQRQPDPRTNRQVVAPGTFHRVTPHRLGLARVFLAVPKGIADAVSVISVVFLVGGALSAIERTGVLRQSLTALVRRLGARATMAIPMCCVAFAAAGALENMQEEIIALVPALVMLSTRVGGDGVTAAAMSLGAAAVGSAFSPVNPFQVGIAQQIADVALFSGAAFRLVTLIVALALWIWGVMRRTRALPVQPAAHAHSAEASPVAARVLTRTQAAVVMLLVLAGFATFVFGLARYDWGFDELAAVFLAMGIVGGLAGGLGVNGTASAFVAGFRDMAYAALLIGFSRAIYVVLSDGHIVDTLVNAASLPLAHLPGAVAAIGMIGVQTAIHVAVPSVSGQAVLTMPIFAPLADLLGFSRQIAVLAYQYGAGLCELLTPTNGALMAVIAAAGVEYEEWMTFALPQWVLLVGLGALSIGVATALGLH
jgi:uncharacterized ion transporter superfamily protein YfcC